jgi:transcriptional regulator with XRE-family HTH domain
VDHAAAGEGGDRRSQRGGDECRDGRARTRLRQGEGHHQREPDEDDTAHSLILEAFMTFGNIGAKFKEKAQERDAATAPPPMDYEELHSLRSRILGVLIRDARLMKGLSEQQCAVELGVPIEYFEQWELGKRSPTLPQLEMLAYFIGVPVGHFWNTKTISATHDERLLPLVEHLVELSKQRAEDRERLGRPARRHRREHRRNGTR